MPTLAELLCGASGLNSGTLRDHLCEAQGGGGGIGVVVNPARALEGMLARRLLDGQLAAASGLEGALARRALSGQLAARSLSGQLAAGEQLQGELARRTLQGTVTLGSKLYGQFTNPVFQRTAFPYQENVELWFDGDYPDPVTFEPKDRGPNDYGTWPAFITPNDAPSWTPPSTEQGLPGYWTGDNQNYFYKSLAGHPNAKQITGPRCVVALYQPRRTTYNYGFEMTGRPRLKWSTAGGGWSHGEAAGSGVLPASFAGDPLLALKRWALICLDAGVGGDEARDRVRVINHGGAVGPEGDWSLDYRLDANVYVSWLHIGLFSHAIVLNTIPDSTVLYDWFNTNYPHLFDDDVL